MSGIINYTSSPTSTTSQLEYPNAPPTENQVKNELNNATLVCIFFPLYLTMNFRLMPQRQNKPFYFVLYVIFQSQSE